MAEENVDCLGSGLSKEEEFELAADPNEVVAATATADDVRASAWNGDYPDAVWRGIGNGNYTPADRPADYPIQYVVIHYTQGMGFGPIPFGPGGSAHYGANLDGRMDQYIGEAYIAWHAGNWWINCRSVGIEHVGYGRPQDWTDAMLRVSAKLTAHLCKKYGIPIDRGHIVGHSEVKGATHTDPGSAFPWSKYINLVKQYAGGSAPSKPVKPVPDAGIEWVNYVYHSGDNWARKIAAAMDAALTAVGVRGGLTEKAAKGAADAREQTGVYTFLVGSDAVERAKKYQREFTDKDIAYDTSGAVRVVTPSYRDRAKWRIADFCEEFGLDKGAAIRAFEEAMGKSDDNHEGGDDMPDKKKDLRWSSDGAHEWRGYKAWVPPKSSGTYIDKHPTHTTWARKAEETAIWIEKNYPNVSCNTYYNHPPASPGFRQYEYLSMDAWDKAGRGYTLNAATGDEIWDRLWRGDGPGRLWDWAIYYGWGYSKDSGWWKPVEDSYSDAGHWKHIHLTLA